MKLKTFVVILIFSAIIGLFSAVLTGVVLARNQAEISFAEDPTYILTNRLTRDDEPIGWTFQIDIKLKNNGDLTSEELAINITDQEGFTLTKYIILGSKETKNVTFIWSTVYNTDQVITVNYYPSDLDADWTEYNSGSKKFTIIVEDKDALPATSTPGFEIILLLTAIMVVVFYLKKRK